MEQRGIEIDLNGPQGNAFALIGVAKNLSKQLGKDFAPIEERMTSGDYDNLVDVLEDEFGMYVTIYR